MLASFFRHFIRCQLCCQYFGCQLLVMGVNVDCTCTGSLFQCFPELAFDFSDEQHNHDDDAGCSRDYVKQG